MAQSLEIGWGQHVLDSLLSQAGIKAGLSLPTAVLIFLFGENLVLLFVLLLFLAVDLATGIAKAVYMRTFSSEGLRRGAVKLIIYLLLLVLAHQFTRVSGVLSWFDDAIYCYVALTEYESIAENVLMFGQKWPSIRQLREMALRLKGNNP